MPVFGHVGESAANLSIRSQLYINAIISVRLSGAKVACAVVVFRCVAKLIAISMTGGGQHQSATIEFI